MQWPTASDFNSFYHFEVYICKSKWKIETIGHTCGDCDFDLDMKAVAAQQMGRPRSHTDTYLCRDDQGCKPQHCYQKSSPASNLGASLVHDVSACCLRTTCRAEALPAQALIRQRAGFPPPSYFEDRTGDETSPEERSLDKVIDGRYSGCFLQGE